MDRGDKFEESPIPLRQQAPALLGHHDRHRYLFAQQLGGDRVRREEQRTALQGIQTKIIVPAQACGVHDRQVLDEPRVLGWSDRQIARRYEVSAPVVHQHGQPGASAVLSRAIPIIA